MEKLLAPAPIGEGELTDQWERFKREFSQYLVAVGKDDASEQVKLAICLRMVGPRVNDMFETMRFDNEQQRKWDVVRQKLDRLCARRTSRHVIRDQFFQTKQDGRSIDQYERLWFRQFKR